MEVVSVWLRLHVTQKHWFHLAVLLVRAKKMMSKNYVPLLQVYMDFTILIHYPLLKLFEFYLCLMIFILFCIHRWLMELLMYVENGPHLPLQKSATFFLCHNFLQFYHVTLAISIGTFWRNTIKNWIKLQIFVFVDFVEIYHEKGTSHTISNNERCLFRLIAYK